MVETQPAVSGQWSWSAAWLPQGVDNPKLASTGRVVSFASLDFARFPHADLGLGKGRGPYINWMPSD